MSASRHGRLCARRMRLAAVVDIWLLRKVQEIEKHMNEVWCRCRGLCTVLSQQSKVQQRLTQEAGCRGGLIAFHCRVGLTGTRKCTQHMHKVLVDGREDGRLVSVFALSCVLMLC